MLVTVTSVAILRYPETHFTYRVAGLNQPFKRNINADKPVSRPFTIVCDHQDFNIKTRSDITAFATQCKDPEVIKLVGLERLPTHGLTIREFVSLINAPVLEMCIRVEMSTIVELDLSHILSLSGKCDGPRLVIAQNLKLENIKFSRYFMRKSKPDTVVIRGNPKLRKSTIKRLKSAFNREAVDLQNFGECGPPYPFTSMADLTGCKEVFGVISVDKNIHEVARSPHVKGLEFQGCLHITNSKISNVDFLDDIAQFSAPPYYRECAHEIVDNANLCIRDTQHLKTKFEGLVILQNETCEVVCQGGIVDHRYLATVDGCKTINGNLVFQNLHYSNDYQLDNLYSIKRIDGSLRIHNTYGLGHFNALENLKEIAVPPGESGPAIEIIENTGLTSLEFPHLSKIKSSDNVKIIIVKNPYLTMKKALVEKMYKMAHGKQHTKIEFTDSSTLADKFSDHALEAVILILILLIVLMALCIACLIIYPYYQNRRSRNKHGFPKPPWNIGKKSKEILAGWVKDIVAKNPLIWRCSDRDVIWSYKDTDGAHKDIEVLIANNDQFLTDHMLLLAENAKIGESDRFLQCERVKGMLEKEVIIFIGASEHPSGVLPHLPEAVNGEYTYKYLCSSYSFTLKKIKTMAPNTKEYTYDVSCVPKGKKPFRKTTKIIYNRWKNTEMPQEYDEILQLAMTYEPSKTLCASDRRKEVFSLIHLFHTFCLLLQEPINLVDALQLHTEKCNASMLDRSELLYVMAVIMEWAYQSRSVTPELKKKHMEWCHSYAIMDRFMRKNKNIKLIHPDYLTKLDSHTRHSVLVEGFVSSPRFSERESAAISDPFRRKDADQMSVYKRVRRKKVGDSEDTEEGDADEDDDMKFWMNQKKSGSKEKTVSSDVKTKTRSRGSGEKGTLRETSWLLA